MFGERETDRNRLLGRTDGGRARGRPRLRFTDWLREDMERRISHVELIRLAEERGVDGDE